MFTGCVADSGGEGFMILNNTAPPQGMCLLTGATGQPFISHGEISTLSPSGYLFTPLIQSKITATSTTDTTKTITFDGANVELTVEAVTLQHADGTFTKPAPTPLTGTDNKFQALFSGSLMPGGTANVSFEIIPVSTIATIVQNSGAAATDHLSAEVKAVINPFGTMGGDRVNGTPFQYPVTVCNDCVVVNHGACPITGGTVRVGDECQPFQDGTVDCCTSNGVLTCPGTM
jgi:hypothetical protein